MNLADFAARNAFLVTVLVGLALVARAEDASPKEPAPKSAPSGFRIDREKGVIVVKGPSGVEALRYQLEKPADSKLSVESACYFHPFATPSGVPVTEVAPQDHLHHRGVFLAWVEMHGKKAGDFWGWGEPVTKDGRKIVHRDVTDIVAGSDGASFRARNEWLADGTLLVKEDLRVKVKAKEKAHVVDLFYTFTVDAGMTLEQWAFSGFCVRCRKDGEVQAEGPKGQVRLLDPKHTDPRTDWPAELWYAFTLKLEGDKTVSVAVLDHPQNPPTLWHNNRGLRMLNPCVVAPGRIQLTPRKPLILRYRVVAADGPTSKPALTELLDEWQQIKYPADDASTSASR